ncbi:adhesin, partial [Pseudoalteromonas ruthenica]
ILLYHLIADSTVLQDAAVALANSNDPMINMANENKATLSYADMVLFINTSAVTTANVNADNGVIHVVNSVMIPPKTMTEPTKTIAQTAIDTPELSTLVSA